REGTNIVVTARVPAGVRRLTLECRARLGPGSWEPRAMARLDGAGGSVDLRLPRSRQLEMMRLRADATEPLPASFYTGTNSFFEQTSSPTGPGMFGGDVFAPGGIDPTAISSSQREVVESDIWKIQGQTLYFF